MAKAGFLMTWLSYNSKPHWVTYKVINKGTEKITCNTTLINLVNKCLSSINKGEIVRAIFYDLRRLLMLLIINCYWKNLHIYKFDNVALSWIKTYLSGRHQCIIDKQLRSRLQWVNAWVPLGSLLGPVLFLLFLLMTFISKRVICWFLCRWHNSTRS